MTIRRTIALAGFALASMSAQASLTTLPTGWPPAGSSGLQGVEFNVVNAGGVMVAMGAHGYKNSATLSNDGVSVFNAQNGLYAADGKGYANWSFDFAWDLGTSCAGCHVFLRADSDPTSGVNMVSSDITALGNAYADSWNLKMSFIPFAFDAFDPSSTAFELQVIGADGRTVIATSDITVNVPEPTTLALTGLALAGLGFARRRKS